MPDVPRETVSARRRGRPPGWRAIPPSDFELRLQAARVRIEARGRRPTQRRIAELLGVSERTVRTYLAERRPI